MLDLIEAQIRAAIERGDFDNLPGKGKKLDLSGDDKIPEEHRMAYRVLKNAGYAPPEVAIKNDLEALRQRIKETDDPDLKRKLRIELASKESVLALKIERMRKTR